MSVLCSISSTLYSTFTYFDVRNNHTSTVIIWLKSLFPIVDPFFLFMHCKYLNAWFECNDIVIFVYSHYPLDPNAKSSDTKGNTDIQIFTVCANRNIQVLFYKGPEFFFIRMKVKKNSFFQIDILIVGIYSWR